MSTPIPQLRGPFLQPKRNLSAWAARGSNVAIDRDRESNADGSDGVTLAQWQAAAIATGLKYIVDPSANLAADAADPNRLGWLYPIDELDDKIINAQDAKNAALTEALYVGLETFYKKCKAASATMPVWINLDGSNIQWHKVDYARIIAACDHFSVDYYPIQRGQPVASYTNVINAAKALGGGNKLAMAYIETSFQHLNPTYFPGKRGPTVAEWQQQVALAVGAGLNVGWFPQCIGEDKLAGFSTDATDPAIAAAMTAWLVTTPPPVVVSNSPQPAPLNGKTMTLDGYSYTLAAK